MTRYDIPGWDMMEAKAETLIKENLSGRVLEQVRIHKERMHALRVQCAVAIVLTLILNTLFMVYPIRETETTSTQTNTSTFHAERRELLSSL